MICSREKREKEKKRKREREKERKREREKERKRERERAEKRRVNIHVMKWTTTSFGLVEQVAGSALYSAPQLQLSESLPPSRL